MGNSFPRVFNERIFIYRKSMGNHRCKEETNSLQTIIHMKMMLNTRTSKLKIPTIATGKPSDVYF
ncbi:hypothetical protein BDR07DRAFT_1433933 [Suillus spraguei]|nr:hypothetical protein BDR07DRAFT_1433933 [Suillus spraguei]